jgi:arabinofuranan 3-O-arabinosyltransferase
VTTSRLLVKDRVRASGLAVRRTVVSIGLWSRYWWIVVVHRAGFRSHLIAYLTPTLIALVTAQAWFKPGTVIAAGDYAPPFAPGDQYRSHWNHFTDGAGSPSFEIVSLPYYETLQAFAALGFDPEVAQRIWLSGLFAGCAAAVVFFAFGIRWSPLAAGTAGLLAAFNAFWLTSLPSPIPAAALVLAGVLGGLLVRAALGSGQRSVVIFALVTMGLAYVFRNPPHVVLVMAWLALSLVLACSMGGWVALRRGSGFLLRAAPLVALLNAWWIVPVVSTIVEPSFSVRFAAADVASLEWVHQRASLANALSLNVFWAWGFPEYFPYAARLDGNPFTVLKYSLPALAVLGLVFARGVERRPAGVLAAFGGLVILVAKGLHPPLSEVNRSLYEHLPGFWLFREPSKTLLLLAFIFALLGGLAVARLVRSVRRPASAGIVAAALCAGAIAYVHPLITGEVIPDERGNLPPAHVRVPEAWQRAAALLNAQGDEGKAVVLPNYPFYQVSTEWGYHGAPFERELIRRPVLELQPGGYFQPPDAVARILGEIQGDLIHGKELAALRKLNTLGVEYVLLRRDLDSRVLGHSLSDPRILARTLNRAPGLNLLASFGVVEIYHLDQEPSEITSATPVVFGGAQSLVPTALEGLPGDAALVTTNGATEDRFPSQGGQIRLTQIGNGLVRQVKVRVEGDELVAHTSDALSVALAGHPLPGSIVEELRFPGARDPFLLTLGGRVLAIQVRPKTWLDLGNFSILRSQPVQLWPLERAVSLDLETAGQVGDCRHEDERSAAEVGITASVLRVQGAPVLRLAARDHAACVSFPVSPYRATRRYRVTFDYRTVEGNPPRACIWQEGAERCAPVPDLESSQDWRRFEATVAPESQTTGLRLFFYADGGGEVRTVTDYRHASVEIYRPGSKQRLTETNAEGTTVTLPPGDLSLDVQRSTAEQTIDLDAAGRVGDCRREDERSAAEVGITASVLRVQGAPVLRLAARDHAACVSFPVLPFQETRHYRVGFEYRNVEGNRARVCIWQEGAERCAPTPLLESSSDWRRFETTVAPESQTTGLRLFFYADANGERTTTEYRDVALTPVDPVGLMAIPVAGELPEVGYERIHPGQFRVRVTNATEPFLLAAAETYASGWRLEIENREASEAKHVMVNGYANGWLIPWKGSYDLTISYQPESLAHKARQASFFGLFALLIWLVVRRKGRLLRLLRTRHQKGSGSS